MRVAQILFAFCVLLSSRVSAQNAAAIDLLNSGVEKINFRRDTASALADLNKSIQLDSTGVSYYLSRAIIHSVSKKYDRAIECLNLGITNYPRASELYGNRANLKSILKDYSGAIEDYSIVVKLNPKDAIAYLNIGNLEHNIKNYQAALSDFNTAILLDSTNAIAFVRRSNTKDYLKDYSGSILDAEMAIGLEPTFAEAYYIKAFPEFHVGMKERACADWAKALNMGYRKAKYEIQEKCK